MILLAVILLTLCCLSHLWRFAWRYHCQAGRASFWGWPTALAYGFTLWAVYCLLTGAGMRPHAHPWLFILFGLSLGLGLTLLDQGSTYRSRPKKQEDA